jgi:hypothetical protein
MTDWNDLPDEMRKLQLDPGTIDRLLAGEVEPDDAPPGYSEVARVLQAAAGARHGDELAHEASHVVIAMELVRQPSPASTPSDRRSRNMSKIHRLKVGGLVVVGALVGSTGLAAAGVLPDAAQDAVSNVFDRVGITIPASGDHPETSGDEISGIATTTDATGVDKGAEISAAASGGMSQAGQHGAGAAESGTAGADAAPVPVPNEGGTGTADTASGGASDAGTTTADTESDGHSSEGSGNASVEPPVPDVAAVPTAHAP